MRTVINIPTYQERENLPSLLDEILATTTADVRVLDDGSPDGTGEYAEQVARTNPRVRVVHRDPPRRDPSKREAKDLPGHVVERLRGVLGGERFVPVGAPGAGLARAYQDGLSRAVAEGYDRIFLMDADFTHQPRHLAEMISALSTADMVVGSRYASAVPMKAIAPAVLKSLREHGVAERAVARGGNAVVAAALALPIRDVTSGFMGFRRHVLQAIEPSTIRSEGPAFLIELKYRAHRAGFSIVELPIFSFERAAGPSKRSHLALGGALVRAMTLRLRGRT